MNRRLALVVGALAVTAACSTNDWSTQDPAAGPADADVAAASQVPVTAAEAAPQPLAAPPIALQPFAGTPEPIAAGLVPAAQPVFAGQSADDRVDAERARLDLLAAKTKVLVDQYLANASALESRFDFAGSERELLKARDLDPANPQVAAELSRLQTLLGRPAAMAGTLAADAQARFDARGQQARMQALQDLTDARDAMQNEDFDLAVVLSRGVVQRASSSPEIDWAAIPAEANAVLDQAESGRGRFSDGLRRQKEAETYRLIQEEERREVEQHQEKINALMRSATDNFLRGNYVDAEELARAVLKDMPTNEQALELVDASRDAARGQLKQQALAQRSERFRVWREDMEEVRTPYSEIVNASSDEFWDQITAERAGARALGLEPIDPEEVALRARLAATTMDADFDDLTIQQVANNIFFNTDVPVSVDPEVVLDLDDAGETVSLLGLRNLSVESLLNIITDQVGDELAWTVRNGRVYITKQEKADGDPIIKIHNIQDLTFPLTDFKGANLRDITLPGEAGDDNETTIFSSELERVRLIEPDEIENLIRENIARESWDLSDNYSIGFVDSNNLLVVHTPQTQQEIADFLNDLRSYSTSMVTLESRFIGITDAFIEEIGTDLRGLGPTGGNLGTEFTLDDINDPNATQGLDNSGSGNQPPEAGFFKSTADTMYAASVENFFQNPLGDLLSTVGGGAFQFSILNNTEYNLVMTAVQKSLNALEITAPIVSVFNTQRAFVTVVNQISYVQGFDVDVANAARIADPIIGILQEGIVLDVRPTVSFDRKYVTLDVQTTVADLVSFEIFETNLGSDVGGSVEFVLPTLDVQDARTTVVVPDGGSVILAGFKNVTYQNRTAEAPWLGNIPVVGFFFQEKGLSDEMEDLVILIRATISDFQPLQEAPVAGN